MILKKLTIHNIASIADAEIDFSGETLGNSSIFLITGETGAGKSTILDAICLALYDDTPRMTSISKEEITFGAEGNDRYYSNDNSQFLRRGTGEGWVRLQFTGCDDISYEASWAIQRNHKKPEKKLQKSTRSLVSADGVYMETNKRRIPEKIIEITGLDYDQFCRTVMLAQGEFTKFLKSGKGEKSEILEKLTGTAIYSDLGKMIAEKYLHLKSEWEECSKNLKNITLLSVEDISERNSRIKILDEDIARLQKTKVEMDMKLKWMTDRNNLEKLLLSTGATISRYEEETSSEEFLSQSKLIADHDLTVEIRTYLREEEKCEKLIALKKGILPELERSARETDEKLKGKCSEVESMQKDLKEFEKNMENFDLSKINGELHVLNLKYNDLNSISADHESLETLKKHISEYEEEAAEKKKAISEYTEEIASLTEPLRRCEERLSMQKAALDKAELAGTKAAKELRSTLVPGDMCPVCGRQIEELINDKLVDSILNPLREEKNKSEKELLGLRTKKITSEKLIAENEKSLKSLQAKIDSGKVRRDNIREKLLGMLVKYEICVEIDENTAGKIAACKRETENHISEIRNQQTTAEQMLRHHKKMISEIDRAQKELASFNEMSVKCRLALTECRTDMESNINRMEYLKSLVADFVNDNPGITDKRLDELNAISAESFEGIRKRHTDLTELLNRERGAYGNISSQIASMEEARPDIQENESEDTLNTDLATLTESLNMSNREIGQIREQLENDSKSRIEYDVKIRELEKAGEEKERWEGLYRMLGDTDGAKFRNVAQSYILKSLLDNANFYMQSFTDRYTLTCNPGSLAILVKDCYRPTDPQPVGILSGGESFMASLSLALALSNLRSGGNGADILFIDEGFGTLSPEYLGNVMDTLEKLHQIGGRKVGLISHVAEMKERIPVQIRVIRESPALSIVKVVDSNFELV